ncbi:sensor histidine kinase [Marinifilum sp.]|uniref:sensor histidine kinase n=1 Tax=Marinifilum sp. TaxID=2033137 RepID=UPI003BAA7C97
MSLIIKKQTAFYLILFFALNSFARYSRTDDFTQVNGLPSNCVNYIFEDSRGLIWLATDVGLCEFNGHEIRFRKELDRLQGEKVTCLAEDVNGNLLITATGVGICEFDGEKLKVLGGFKDNSQAEMQTVSAFGKTIVVGASNGVFVRENDGELFNYSLVNGSNRLDVSRISLSSRSLIIFPKLEQGSYSFDLKGIYKREFKKKNVLEVNRKYNGSLRIGDQIILKREKENFKCDVLNCLSNNDELFVLLRYFKDDIESRTLVSVKDGFCKDIQEERGLRSVFVQSIFKHKHTNDIWLGTKNHGLIRLKQSIFSIFSVESKMPEVGTVADFISLTDGSIVLAGSNGVARIKDEKIQSFLTIKDFEKLPSLAKKQYVIINDIEIDRDIIWVATNHGFFTINSNTFQLSYKGISKALNFILLSNNKLFYYDGRNFVTSDLGFNSRKQIYKTVSGRQQVEITNMIEFDSKVWVSTDNQGIFRFDKDKVYKFGRNNCGIHNVVNDMLILPDSSIIAGGNNGILYKLKSEGNQLVIKDSLDNSDGLEGITIHGFQYLQDGSIWCGTNLGVHRFEYESWHPDSVVKYRFWNAPKDVVFRGEESLIDKYGCIWVHSNHSLMKIKASDFDADKTSYQPSLFGVKIRQDRWKSKKSEVNKWTKIPNNPIYLNYNENNVSFHFGMFYCHNLENVKYRCRLLGLDKNWSDWTRSNEVIFSNLRGGDYVFELEGRKLSSGQVLKYSIDIILDTAWWKTTWFGLILSFILCLLVYYSIKLYKRRIRFEEKKRTKQYNRVIGLKIKALQYQLDPHFIFNSLNAIQSYILEEEEDKALEYLSDFSMVLRNNINNANKNMISLNEELAYLKIYLKLEQMRFEDKFSFQINIDKNINNHDVQIPPMLIQPFLEHAIKYGISKLKEKGKLVIRFVLEKDGYLKCEIIDNGLVNRQIDINNSVSDLIKGNSLQITCDRMKLLNKVLTNGRTYSYKINEIIDSKSNFSGVITEIGFPKLK